MIAGGLPQPLAGTGRGGIIRFAILALCVQAAFWGIALLLRPPVADQRLARNAVTNIKLEQPDGTLGEADGPPRYYLGTGPDARFAAQVRVLQPDRGLVVFVPRYNRWASLTVNGQTMPLSDAPAWRGGRLGAKWVVPPAMLHRGDNVLVVEVRRECCKAFLSGVIAAPGGTIDNAIRQWRMQVMIPAFGVMVLGLFGTGSCLLLAIGPAYRREAFAAATAFAGLALGGLWQIDIFTPTTEPVFIATGWAALLLTFSGLVALIDRWFPGGPRFDRWLVVFVPVWALLILVSAMATDPPPVALRTALEVSIVLFANIAIIASLWRGLAIGRAQWSLDAAVVLLVPTISLADVVDSLDRDPLTLSTAPLGLFGLAILLLLGIVRRGRMLSIRLENANLLLEQTISFKQAEIEATAQLLRQREAEAAVQSERARIMQDMHDGMGGHLLSVLTQARNPAVPRETIEATVEQAITDLRLMIDSLDSVGDTLDFALGQFRERAEAKLRAAGMELVWRNDLPGAYLILPPGTILAIYRIMQEAINNAVRHSGADRVEIGIRLREDGAVVIAILDDGSTDRSSWKAGRGLTNMERRAKQIGGHFSVTVGADGTRATLILPTS
ncbi:sensor histidine kinase [Erythrobacter tepidarius]|uniref:sensor histidine kinase n=1 Tax=Erythrobacter tepidarius TaxID=60454 RepID=UPI00117C8025|nr:ATP-binding protein [Erythrobacter tepidarius]